MKPQTTILANRKKRVKGRKREVTPEHPAIKIKSVLRTCAKLQIESWKCLLLQLSEAYVSFIEQKDPPSPSL